MLETELFKRKKTVLEVGKKYVFKSEMLFLNENTITITSQDDSYYYYESYLKWDTEDGIAYSQLHYTGIIKKDSPLLKHVKSLKTNRQIRMKRHMLTSLMITSEICKGLFLCSIFSLAIYGMMSLQEFKAIDYKILNISDMQLIFQTVLPFYIVSLVISKGTKKIKSMIGQ